MHELDDVGDEAKQRRGIDVDRQRKAVHVRFRAVGNRRQQHHLRPAAMGLLANLLADDRPLVHVRAVGQMQIVRLRRPQRQHGHLVGIGFGVGVVGFREDVRTHGEDLDFRFWILVCRSFGRRGFSFGDRARFVAFGRYLCAGVSSCCELLETAEVSQVGVGDWQPVR